MHLTSIHHCPKHCMVSNSSFRILKIQHLVVLCYFCSSRIVVIHGFSVNENEFGSIAHDAIDFAESISLQPAATAGHQSQNRSQFLHDCWMAGLLSSCTFSTFNPRNVHPSHALAPFECTIHHPFQYSNDWTGTSLHVVDISTAVSQAVPMKKSREGNVLEYRWPMGRWPDPILRQSSNPVDSSLFGNDVLRRACDILRNTALAEGAVGLAAQQCGVNARIIYLKLPSHRENSYLLLINPRIVRRSSEKEMKVWREDCLVLPRSFQATVLRDAWVDVEYQDWTDKIPHSWHVKRMYGEQARAIQHELDHDRGILVTDHVSLDELENDLMRLIERPGHEQRMSIAYDRYMF